MKRRRISALPLDVVETRPFWEIMRVLCTKTGGGAAMADRIWDHMSFDFTRHVARRITRSVGAVYAYEYGALEAFVAAEKHGIARILDFPSLNGREFEEQQRREKDLYPELKDADEEYFAARFERRQARRDEEMARADVIITNSHITRESHIAGGADPDKIFAVPLGAPLPIERVRARPLDGPLKIVWAGTFSIRKGAHHFLEAWRSVGKSGAATADIYGALALPDRIRRSTPSGVSFHGSIPHSSLLDVFETADILVFPTLSDGFGMVITEAFSRGLPVITTTRAGASDLVEHEKNGLLIPAGDPKAIARSLEWCLENRERLAQMRQAALQTARGWQWSDYRRALIDVVSIGLTRAGYQPEFAAQPCIEA
jgi:glycosyltransferase involved in cell wall biosynthesis